MIVYWTKSHTSVRVSFYNKLRNLCEKKLSPLFFTYLLLLFIYLMWGISTISKKQSIPAFWFPLSALFTILAFVLWINVILKLSLEKTISQIRNILFCVEIASLFLVLDNLIQYNLIKIIFWGVFSICIWIGVIQCNRKKKNTDNDRKNAQIKFLKIGFGIFIFSILIADSNMLQFRWDSLMYFQVCDNLDIGSLSNLALYGHISQGYSLCVYLVKIFTRKTEYAMVLCNYIFYWISVVYFYKIVDKLGGYKKFYWNIILTGIYALSPFSLGMLFNYSLDFPCQCFFVPVIYYMMEEEWLYFCCYSFFFCFTKEPAIIAYICLCIGYVIQEITPISSWKEKARYFINVFCQKKYYVFLLPFIFWIITYKILGGWAQGQKTPIFSFQLSYIWKKLAVLYILNFNWIFTIIVVFGIIFYIYTKKIAKIDFFFPLLCSQLGFTLFSCIFKTENHPRYVDTNEVTLYLLSIIIIINISRGYWVKVIGVIIGIVQLISCFITIDPISLLVFPVVNIGTSKMIRTADNIVGDGMIYNRQSLWMEKCLEKAIADALEDNSIIMFPTSNNNPYGFDGMALAGEIKEKYREDVEFWDNKNKKRIPRMDNASGIIKVIQVADNVTINDLSSFKRKRLNYIYSDFVNEKLANIIKESCSGWSEEQYNYRGWNIKRISFVLE